MGHSFAEAFTATLPPRSHRYFQSLIGFEVAVFVRIDGISNPTFVNVTSTADLVLTTDRAVFAQNGRAIALCGTLR
jgi:hypothetical protein